MKVTLHALFGLGRPIILLGVLMVHGAGVAAAFAQGHALDAPALLWGFMALFFAGISVNFVNEYADYQTDALTQKTRYSGGSGVLPSGKAPRSLALRAGWITLLIGLATAAVGALAGILTFSAWAVLAVGAFGGWMYSLPPLKLAWNGGAEAANAILGGLVLPLYGYTLLARSIDLTIIAVFLPYALMIFITAMATTWPDREADAQVGKYTLATRLTPLQLRRIYIVIAAAAFLLLPAVTGWAMPPQVMVVSFVALPAAIVAARRYTIVRNPHATARAAMMMIFAQTTAFFWLGLYANT
jgi:1,4-dihydroxy-2-naphthoate octaprenyltransferase